jgi:hypothetical protein
MCRDRRRRSLSDAVETVWKVSGTGQPPHHEPYHCGVDERLRACAQPLVVFAHPPVLPQPREGEKVLSTTHLLGRATYPCGGMRLRQSTSLPCPCHSLAHARA